MYFENNDGERCELEEHGLGNWIHNTLTSSTLWPSYLLVFIEIVFINALNFSIFIYNLFLPNNIYNLKNTNIFLCDCVYIKI